MLSELHVGMPSNEVKGKIEYNLVMWFRQQPLDDQYPTLWKPSTPCHNNIVRTCLDDILKVSCGKLLQCRDAPTKALDSIMTKCWDLTEPECHQQPTHSLIASLETNWASNVWTAPPPTTCNMQRMCRGMSLPKLSSTLCRGSTTINEDGLRPSSVAYAF